MSMNKTVKKKKSNSIIKYVRIDLNWKWPIRCVTIVTWVCHNCVTGVSQLWHGNAFSIQVNFNILNDGIWFFSSQFYSYTYSLIFRNDFWFQLQAFYQRGVTIVTPMEILVLKMVRLASSIAAAGRDGWPLGVGIVFAISEFHVLHVWTWILLV